MKLGVKNKKIYNEYLEGNSKYELLEYTLNNDYILQPVLISRYEFDGMEDSSYIELKYIIGVIHKPNIFYETFELDNNHPSHHGEGKNGVMILIIIL